MSARAVLCIALLALTELSVATSSIQAPPRMRKPAQVQAALAGWQVYFDGDTTVDHCRIVTRSGFSGLSCRLSSINQEIESPNLDLGYEEGRAFVDVDGDERQDYCRVVGNGYPHSFVTCTLSEGQKFGETILSPPLDWGYPDTRQWRDANGDGKADFCRLIGSYRELMACTFSLGRKKPYFGRTATTKR